jgi:type IV secretory pathway VirB2 component (pilin)
MGQTDAQTRWAWPALLALAGVAVLQPDLAYAASGGGALPWDGPLTTLRNDITGPVAFSIALLAMVAAGAALAFGGEISQFTRAMIMVVLIGAFITGVVNVAAALGITGAVV